MVSIFPCSAAFGLSPVLLSEQKSVSDVDVNLGFSLTNKENPTQCSSVVTSVSLFRLFLFLKHLRTEKKLRETGTVPRNRHSLTELTYNQRSPFQLFGRPFPVHTSDISRQAARRFSSFLASWFEWKSWFRQCELNTLPNEEHALSELLRLT